MKVNVKTKKMQEVEIVETKEVDLEKLIKVLKTRLDLSNEENDMVCVSKESLEDAIIVLEDCFNKDERINSFEKEIPEDMLKELKGMAAFLALSGIKPC